MRSAKGRRIRAVLTMLALILGMSSSAQAGLTLMSVSGAWTEAHAHRPTDSLTPAERLALDQALWPTVEGDRLDDDGNLDTGDVVSGGSGYGNLTENRVFWGRAQTDLGKSGLGFTGIAPTKFAVPEFPEITLGTPFQLGQLRHFNFVIDPNPLAKNVDLTIDIEIKDTSTVDESFTFTMDVNETPNGSGPPASDDLIKFQNLVSDTTFDLDGMTYTLGILGFGSLTVGPDPNEEQVFQSPEGTTNSTLLWAQITKVDPEPEPDPDPEPEPVIPAPGAVLLGSLGVGLVGLMRRRFYTSA